MKGMKTVGCLALTLVLLLGFSLTSAHAATKAALPVNILANSAANGVIGGDPNTDSYIQILPDGTTQPFSLTTSKGALTLVINTIIVGFTADSTLTAPPKLAIETPTGNPPVRFLLKNMDPPNGNYSGLLLTLPVGVPVSILPVIRATDSSFNTISGKLSIRIIGMVQ